MAWAGGSYNRSFFAAIEASIVGSTGWRGRGALIVCAGGGHSTHTFFTGTDLARRSYLSEACQEQRALFKCSKLVTRFLLSASGDW